MNRKTGMIFACTTALGALVLALTLASAPPTARAQAPGNAAYAPNAVAWDTDGNRIGNEDFLGTTNRKPLKLRTHNTERMRIAANGNITIGTTVPKGKLDVWGDWSDETGYGALTLEGVKPTIRFSGDPVSGNKQWLLHLGALGPGNLEFFTGVTGNWKRIMSLTQEGVAIGSSNALGTTLNVVGPDTSGGTVAFRVGNSAGSPGLLVFDDRRVGIGALASATASKACLNGSVPYVFAPCIAAAEYVPTIDPGTGYPETADLVSIVPAAANPYGDTQGPFSVRKSAEPCDSNLLGFIVKPESGADGVKLNDHYLPLAMYGYFPAKVTMENGAIQRGDAITSSSKAGYGMKATGACKVIGYALEDAHTDGTIQVFARLGENAAEQVAELRGQMDALREDNRALKQENATLKQELTAIGARLGELEERMAVTSGEMTKFSTAH